MKAENFIILAGKLAAQAATEPANARTATSRAYYGAFHLVRSYLNSLNFAVGKDHDLHKPHMATRHPVAMEAGRLLGNLYEDRRRADYELTNVNCEHQIIAEVSVEQATRVKSLLQQLELERSVVKSNLQSTTIKNSSGRARANELRNLRSSMTGAFSIRYFPGWKRRGLTKRPAMPTRLG